MDNSAEQDQRVMRLLAAALKRPPAERDDFLRGECGDDRDLLREVTDAVAWEERMGDFLRRPLVACADMDRPFHQGEVVSSRFEIIREIGEGGMGVVYEAFDRKRKHRICIKTAKLGFRRALSPELEGALNVRHPNICVVNEIHSAQSAGGEIDFLTMEFIEGETLSAYLAAHGKLAPDDALSAARQLCAAVAEAHRSGVIHRDLKGGNVMLSRDRNGALRAVVTDFGLAGDPTDYAGYLGTPRYMAPELWHGEAATAKSDVYALGVVLYEIVTGLGPGPYPAPPTVVVHGLDARWDRAVMPCLRTSPAERPDAGEVLACLQRKPQVRRSRAAAVVVVALCALGAALPLVRTPILRRFSPPGVRLVILPPEIAPGDESAAAALQLATARISRLPSSPALVVIASTAALARNVRTSAQAAAVLHATHALETSLRREGDSWLLHAELLDLATRERVGEFTAVYSAATLANLPLALTGSVAAALHLPAPEAETPTPRN